MKNIQRYSIDIREDTTYEDDNGMFCFFADHEAAIRKAQAEAWDEGYCSGLRDGECCATTTTYTEATNPYKAKILEGTTNDKD